MLQYWPARKYSMMQAIVADCPLGSQPVSGFNVRPAQWERIPGTVNRLKANNWEDHRL